MKILKMIQVVFMIGMVWGCTISGKITTEDGAGIEGVTVTLSGNASMTTVTDAFGNYQFSGRAIANGEFSITPESDGFIFEPERKHIVLGSSSVANVDFEGYPQSTESCRDHEACEAGYYCKKTPGDCEGSGQCTLIPILGRVCPENPVCGCDGETYRSACDADDNGVNIRHTGTCLSVQCRADTAAADCAGMAQTTPYGYWSCENASCIWNEELDPEVGAKRIETRTEFNALAGREDFPGAMGMREVKFVIEGVDTDSPTIYFSNSINYIYHYDFFTDGLGRTITLTEFNNVTYFTDTNRKNLAGGIVAHDAYQAESGASGIYTIEFWPSDPVTFDFVKLTWDLVTENMPFAVGKIAYHPSSETLRELFESEKDRYLDSNIRTIATNDLFSGLNYSALNPGEAYGILRIDDGELTASVRDIILFTSIPNDLPHVAGIITNLPQTPLSHVNLKAKQNQTPNAYIKAAATLPDIVALNGEYVHYQVSADGYLLEPATQQEVDAFLESVRPTQPQVPARDLTVVQIGDLSDLGASDSLAYGSKAANVAELAKILPTGMVPDGYGVPFYFYDEFMKHNQLYAQARTMIDDAAFKSDPEKRKADLKAFRKRIKTAEAPRWMMEALDTMHKAFPPDVNIRMRSSTNNEDLVGFNGAGLYNSKTHKPDEGHIINTTRDVWAGLWTYRAFEERDFYRIDHFRAAMGILVHPSYRNELANGVAVTKNIYDPNWTGFYVNVQVGEDLVTNPEEASIPEEFLIAAVGENREYEVQYIRHSNKIPNGENVLSPLQIAELTSAMEIIQNHFKQIYVPPGETNPLFAMDIEFKITAEGILNIKQARPWID